MVPSSYAITSFDTAPSSRPSPDRAIAIMPLSKTPDVSLEHRQKLSDEQAFAPCSPDFFSLTRRRTTTDKNSNNNMTMSPIQNLNSQSPPEKMTPVKKHHRHYHVNRPRSKSESEALHHRSTSIKKGNFHSPGGHYYQHHVQSPMTVSPSSSKRSLGKMWIRPVSVKKNQWNQVIEQQQGTSTVSHHDIPLLPDFGYYQSKPLSGNNSHEDDEDAPVFTASNSSFHVYRRDVSGLNEASSKKLAFTFGESGKPIKSSLAKRHSPTSVI